MSHLTISSVIENAHCTKCNTIGLTIIWNIIHDGYYNLVEKIEMKWDIGTCVNEYN